MRHCWLLVALCASGCKFSVAPFDPGPSLDNSDDLSRGARDLGAGNVALDLTPLPPPPDMVPPFLPAHVGPGYWHSGAADLPDNVTTIDTSALTINGSAPPAGVTFAVEATHSSWAVLSIGGWNVTQKVTVTGARALIVVASKTVTVGALIDAGGKSLAPGPGALSSSVGAGAGGMTLGDSDGGGGGGGFGTPGEPGGDSDNASSAPGGAAGLSYGALVGFFGGGSSGGNGGSQAKCSDATFARGGGGGGAVQISSSAAIVVQAGGAINVGGGGGTGGCGNGMGGAATGGGGGGSGGLIFLEAPMLSVAGKLAANGGAGGGSGDGSPTPHTDGTPGGDGALSISPALGGSGGQGGGFLVGPNSADGGNGATATNGATRGGSNTNGGGSGGGVGRIWLRTGTVAPVIAGGSVLSPSPTLDATL